MSNHTRCRTYNMAWKQQNGMCAQGWWCVCSRGGVDVPLHFAASVLSLPHHRGQGCVNVCINVCPPLLIKQHGMSNHTRCRTCDMAWEETAEREMIKKEGELQNGVRFDTSHGIDAICTGTGPSVTPPPVAPLL